jgi:cytidylate kinase
MHRIIIISGLSFTGKTSFSNKLACLLNWEFISAGQRFRSLCAERGFSIDSIPKECHLELDKIIKIEIIEKNNTIIEGRYLGLFSQKVPSVLKILLRSDYNKRVERCFLRECRIVELNAAKSEIDKRDEIERNDSNDLYQIRKFDDESFFDAIIINNDLNDFQKGLKKIYDLINES